MGTGLVMFAVPQEATPFVRRSAAAGHAVRREGRCVATVSRQWSVGGHRVLVSGMGAARAVAAARAAMELEEPDWVLTCGFAGGLAPGLRLGDVLHDVDPWFPVGFREDEAGARPGRFHCSDRVAVTRGEKERLRNETGADAVEMESGAIRDLCRARGVPSATVRVVSDEAGEDLPLDFNALMTEAHELHPGRMAWALARAPWKVVELIRFQRRVARASSSLAGFLVRWMGRLDGAGLP